MTTNADRRSVVDGIRRENEDEFGERARAAVQKLLSAGLPPPWMYVYELTQNALDAGARRVCWRSEGDAVTFQHDGRLALDESHVRGLSSLGASTKGLATVGFMGVGFKSVFARFREACVSGADWRFRFDVHVRGGDLGSEVPEWFDTLRPHWDDEAPAPDAGYTTAFFLGRPADRQRPVADDLERAMAVDPQTGSGRWRMTWNGWRRPRTGPRSRCLHGAASPRSASTTSSGISPRCSGRLWRRSERERQRRMTCAALSPW